jgi:hypothetical protein
VRNPWSDPRSRGLGYGRHGVSAGASGVAFGRAAGSMRHRRVRNIVSRATCRRVGIGSVQKLPQPLQGGVGVELLARQRLRRQGFRCAGRGCPKSLTRGLADAGGRRCRPFRPPLQLPRALVTGTRGELVHGTAMRARHQVKGRTADVAELRPRRIGVLAQRAVSGAHYPDLQTDPSTIALYSTSRASAVASPAACDKVFGHTLNVL